MLIHDNLDNTKMFHYTFVVPYLIMYVHLFVHVSVRACVRACERACFLNKHNIFDYYVEFTAEFRAGSHVLCECIDGC